MKLMRSGQLACALALAVAIVAAPSVARDIGTGAFPNAAAVETLQRGVSTKVDVQRLLGVPNGSGEALLAPLGNTPQEIWYYEDVEATDMKSHEGIVTMNLRMQLLLVFFKGDVFDGYMWTSNRSPVEAK